MTAAFATRIGAGLPVPDPLRASTEDGTGIRKCPCPEWTREQAIDGESAQRGDRDCGKRLIETRRGFAKDEIGTIWGENWLRVMKGVWGA